MKLTIVREDGAVYIDGVSFSDLDLSATPQNVHALQFNDALSKGWIEFADDDFGVKPQNEYIDALPSWALEAVNKWTEAKQLYEATIVAPTQASPNQPTTTGTQAV